MYLEEKELNNLNKLILDAQQKIDRISKDYEEDENAIYLSSEEEQDAIYSVYGEMEQNVCNKLDDIDTSFVMDCLWASVMRDDDCPAISKEELDDIQEVDSSLIASEIVKLWAVRQNKYMWRTAIQ